MTIQDIIVQDDEICSETDMYYRGNIKTLSGKVCIPAGEQMSFDTYFNAFSSSKWNKYTILQNVGLRVQMQGDIEIKVIHAFYENKVKIENEISCHVEHKGDLYEITSIPMFEEGIIFPVVRAKEDAVFLGGAYFSDESSANEIDIALGICTFKREPFVKRNVGNIIEKIIQNEESPLYKHLEVYLSDNGQTLDASDFAHDSIHLFPNKNAGGAGGFTRTMIEALLRDERKCFSHILLMDDDILLDCRILERTYYFLRYLKKEYRHSMVGGAMLDLMDKYLQSESGAINRGIEYKSFKKGVDLRSAENVIKNEIEDPVNYMGWWYCCIPSSIIRKDNLPLPLFIHYDDIEYGTRNDSGKILLNGICVWHLQGLAKEPVSMRYYNERNMHIALCSGDVTCDKKEMQSALGRRIAGDLLRYRYESAIMAMEGVTDFYKGPDYFATIEPVTNHQKVSRYNYKLEDTGDKDVSDCKVYSDKDKMTPVLIKCALCWMLPPLKKERIVSAENIGAGYFAKKLYVYDETKHQGYYLERNYKQMWKCIKMYFAMRRMIHRDYDNAMKQWRENKERFTNLGFWEEYLEI